MARPDGKAATEALARLATVFQRAASFVSERERRFIVMAAADEVAGPALAMEFLNLLVRIVDES